MRAIAIIMSITAWGIIGGSIIYAAAQSYSYNSEIAFSGPYYASPPPELSDIVSGTISITPFITPPSLFEPSSSAMSEPQELWITPLDPLAGKTMSDMPQENIYAQNIYRGNNKTFLNLLLGGTVRLPERPPLRTGGIRIKSPSNNNALTDAGGKSFLNVLLGRRVTKQEDKASCLAQVEEKKSNHEFCIGTQLELDRYAHCGKLSMRRCMTARYNIQKRLDNCINTAVYLNKKSCDAS